MAEIKLGPDEPIYVRRPMRWSEYVELGREGVEVYCLWIPSREDFERDDDPETVAFVPVQRP